MSTRQSEALPSTTINIENGTRDESRSLKHAARRVREILLAIEVAIDICIGSDSYVWAIGWKALLVGS